MPIWDAQAKQTSRTLGKNDHYDKEIPKCLPMMLRYCDPWRKIDPFVHLALAALFIEDVADTQTESWRDDL